MRRGLVMEGLEVRQLLATDTLSPLALERGDFDRNDALDAADLDLLSARLQLGAFAADFDVNRDGELNETDRREWIESIHRTYLGDSNLDGEFGTPDLVIVFQAGRYEDGIAENADWTSGDWNGDREFDTRDLVAAFQAGAFEKGARPLADVEVQVPSSFGRGPEDEYLTRFDSIDVQGQADPYTLARLAPVERGETETWEVTQATDEHGRFQFPAVALRRGTNQLRLVISDANGQQRATTFTITRTGSSTDPNAYTPWGDFVKTEDLDRFYPASVATAYIPDGWTRHDVVKQLTTLGSNKPLLGRPTQTSATPLLDVTEAEPADAAGSNDTPAAAQLIDRFGTETGLSASVSIEGVLLPIPSLITPREDDGDMTRATETNLTVNTAVRATGTIGDGPYGSQGIPTGDFDFYVVRGVTAGQRITIDVTTPPSSLLDSFLFVHGSSGERVDVNDDDGISTDSFLEFVAPADDDYFISIAGYGSFGPIDPFDSSSGIGASSEGDYEVTIGLELVNDVDMFSFELKAGDIFGATVRGGGSHLTWRDAQGNELLGSGQDASFLYPASSPLPRDGAATISWVAETSGTYVLAVDGGVGTYTLDVAAARPFLETQPRNTRQILYLDFDGETINANDLFGFGAETAALDPLADFLPRWGLTAADEDLVIDAIVATVQENFRDLGLRGNNGDRLLDEVDGHFQLDVVTSRDDLDATGFPWDPFGDRHVSRVIVGGTIEQLGFTTLGIAQSIDPGNFDTQETAVVLLDLLSAPADNPSSLHRFPLAEGASLIDLIGVAVGNIVTHEAGHYFGSWHTNQFNSVSEIMDQGGNLAGLVGVGPDGIFGSSDDIDVDFSRDTFVPNEGFTGVQGALNVIAFGLATGTTDPGMVVTESAPQDNRLVSSPPRDFVIRFLDPDDDTLPISAGDLTVNGTPADSVLRSGPRELTFGYAVSPVIQQGRQSLELAADAVRRAADGASLNGYSAQFGYDALLTQVTSVTPPAGRVELPLGTIRVSFNEAYDPNSVGPDDLRLNLGEVLQVNPLDALTVEYVLGGLVQEGELRVELPDGAVTDTFGNLATGFERSFELEIGQVPFATPLEPKLPMGSLIYDPAMSGTISGPADVDVFSIRIDPGQSISVLLETDSMLRGEIELLRDKRVVGSASAAIAGADVVLQNDPSTGSLIRVNDAPTEFLIRVRGAGESRGEYRLQVLLNAAFEEENLDRPGNDLPAQAQDLEPAFRSLRGNSPDVAAVLGNLTGPLVAQDDFESGQLDPTAWSTRSTSRFGQIQVTGSYGTAGGSYGLIMDVGRYSEPNLNEAIWQVDLRNEPAPLLTFDHVNFNDEPNPFVGDFRDSFPADGIAISGNGSDWHPIFNAPDSKFGRWLNFQIDLAAAAERAGISLNEPVFLKFQQFDDFPIFQDGRGWDNIQIRNQDRADWYRIDLSRNDQITLAATSAAGKPLQLELYDAEGQRVAGGLQLIEPIANGSFESGGLEGWQVDHSGTPSSPWRVSGGGSGGNLSITTTSPQDGDFVAWSGFDGDGPQENTLYQDVTIPAGTPRAELTWLQRIQWLFLEDDAAGKTFALQIRDPQTNQVLDTPWSFTTPTDTTVRFGDTGWQTQTVDLSAYRDSTVRLAFYQQIPDAFSGPGQIELDRLQLNLGQLTYRNVTDVIADQTIASAGEYLVRVTGESGSDYSLLMSRNVGFNLEGNDDRDASQSLGPRVSGRSWMLGHLNDQDDLRDVYVIRASSRVDVETFIPSGADGEFVNQLDPLVRIYDQQGNLVAEDDNSADGRNASLVFRANQRESELYYLEVVAAVGTSGEYVLSVRGADPVAAVNPLDDRTQPAEAVWAAAVLDEVEREEDAFPWDKPRPITSGEDGASTHQFAWSGDVDRWMACLDPNVIPSSLAEATVDRGPETSTQPTDEAVSTRLRWRDDLWADEPFV